MSTRPGPQPGERHSCAVCGYVVDLVTFDDGSGGYRHTAASVDDHVVVPVPSNLISTTSRCDFCTAEGARWELPAEAYVFGAIKLVDEAPSYGSADNWAACDDCAAALRANDWNKVIYRAQRAFERRNPELPKPPREHYALMYRELRQHVTGPVRLFVSDQS